MASKRNGLFYFVSIYLVLLGSTLLSAWVLGGSSLIPGLIITSSGLLLSVYYFKITEVYDILEEKYGVVVQHWAVVTLISILVGLLLVSGVKEQEQANLVQAILPSIITLFAVVITVTLLGIQISSTRYSYRVDWITTRADTLAVYFLPHIFAIILGLYITAQSPSEATLILLFATTGLSIYNLFGYMQWTLDLLRPTKLLEKVWPLIDDEYVSKSVEKLGEEYDPYDEIEFLKSVIFIEVVDPDPLEIVTDVILSRVKEGDSVAARVAIDEFIDTAKESIFLTGAKFSLTGSKLLTWRFIGHINRTFSQAQSVDDRNIMLILVQGLFEIVGRGIKLNRAGVVYESCRLSNILSEEGFTHWSSKEVNTISDELTGLAKVYRSRIQSGYELPGFNMYIQTYRQFALKSIREGFHGRNTSSMLISITLIADTLVTRDYWPKEVILTIGILGQECARHNVVTRHLVHGADVETSITDQAEWSIIELLTLRDKVVESGWPNEVRYNKIRYIDSLISDIENELYEKDEYIVGEVETSLDIDPEIVYSILHEIRMNRGFVTLDEIFTSVDIDPQVRKDMKGQFISIVDELDSIGVLRLNDNQVSSRLSGWRPPQDLRKNPPDLIEGQSMIAEVANNS